MDEYDENLADNKFLNHIKLSYENIFEEAISSNWIICVPKSDIIHLKTVTSDVIFSHILIPVVKEDNTEEFITKNGNEILLQDGCLMLKRNPKKFLNILFEETFYEGKLGKYKVLCVDDYITNLMKEEHDIKSDERINKSRPNKVLRSLRSVNDFADYICQTTNNPLSVNQIDNYRAEILTIPLSKVDIQTLNLKDLRDTVYNAFNKSVAYFENIFDSLSENEASILCICIESYIVCHAYRILFQVSTAEMALKDEKLSRMLHSIKDFNISSFDIKISNLSWLLSAKYELAAVNNFKSPFGKLQCVKRAIDCFESDGILSSDVLLHILVFCIIKCNLSNWFANLSFIKYFNFSITNNKYSYILSSLEAALVYIISSEVNKLSIKNLRADLPNSSLTSTSRVDNLCSKNQINESEIRKTLYEEIKRNNLQGVKVIMESKESHETCDLFTQKVQLCHPLCLCTKCNLVLNKFSLQNKPFNINYGDENMMTPLHIAATYGSAVIVEYLLANGSNTEAQNLDAMTPLLIASYKGHQNVVLLLLHSGCEINVFDNEGNTALHLACMAGHNSCVKALVFYAESVGLLLGFNSQNKYGDTALHLASHWGYSSVVKFLMSQSSVTLSCLDIRNKRNQAPIDCAHDSAISALLNKNACSEKNSDHSRLILLDLNNLSLKNKTMATSPISHPLISKEDISNECDEGSITLRKILKAIDVGDLKLACFYLDINEPIIPSNPILNASQKCHPLCQCRKCFNSAQAKPIKCNLPLMNQIGENHGVLHASVSALNLELCQILLHYGANPNVCTRLEKQNSLHLAILKESYEILELLITFNANVNATDILGNTPLHLCCKHGWRDGVTLLIKAGAKLNINNKNEISPQEEADSNGHMDIVKILVYKITES